MDDLESSGSRSRSAQRNEPEDKKASQAPSKASQRASAVFRQQASSPEVISSLITSLSAISTPVEDLFDSLLPPQAPHSTSPTPSANAEVQTSAQTGTSTQPGMLVGHGFLHPDDAATAPVVRTAKPPSGLSPLTAPKKQTGQHGLHKSGSQESTSIGRLSIEPGPRRSSASISQTSDTSAKSSGKPREKGLKFKASREKVREMDKEWKKKTRDFRSSSKSPTKSSLEEDAFVPEGPRIGDFSDFGDVLNLSQPVVPDRTHSIQRTPLAMQNSKEEVLVDAPSSSPRPIPDRDSSLKKTNQDSNKSRRSRKSYRTSRVQRENIAEASEESATERSAREKSPSGRSSRKSLRDRSTGGNTPDVPPLPLSDSANVETTEDDVTKRINELKAKKEERNRAQSDDDSRRISKHKKTQRDMASRKSLPHPPKASLPRKSKDGQRSGEAVSSPNFDNKMLPIPGRPRDSVISHSSKNSRSQPGSPLIDQNDRLGALSPILRKSSQMDERPSTADSLDDAVMEYICAPRLSHRIYHPQNGRAISFSEVGDPEGQVVFCCLGMGTTRYLTAFYDEVATTLRLRLITPDRPGVGNSEPHTDGIDTPLAWPDDVRAICQHLGLSRFSILAHSAGAIYALATALRMPQHIRGRIHLLAPWIPPSQMTAIGLNQDPIPVTTLPASQRFLRALPTPFLRAANSSFFAMTSTSITTSVQKTPRRSKRRSLANEPTTPTKTPKNMKRNSLPLEPEMPNSSQASIVYLDMEKEQIAAKERMSEYDARLTQAIWESATTNANPAVDLMTCLERKNEIGFRYEDITKAVVIHHGSKDSRVPLENVKWLGGMMRNCEVRVLEGEGHGLMASGMVMGNVLAEISKEWDDWLAVTRHKRR